MEDRRTKRRLSSPNAALLLALGEGLGSSYEPVTYGSGKRPSTPKTSTIRRNRAKAKAARKARRANRN